MIEIRKPTMTPLAASHVGRTLRRAHRPRPAVAASGPLARTPYTHRDQRHRPSPGATKRPDAINEQDEAGNDAAGPTAVSGRTSA